MLRKLNILILLIAGFFPVLVLAKDTYPKLANYYLPFFRQADYEQLSKWDLLIIQADMIAYNPGFFDYYRTRKPDGILLPYIYSSLIHEERNGFGGLELRGMVYDAVNRGNWWLRDSSGNKIQPWPEISAINVTNRDWRNFYVNYLKNDIRLDLWDGVMFDVVDAEIGHYSRNGIDIDANGSADATSTVNQKWREGMAALFLQTKTMLGNKVIVANGNSVESYQPNTNGRIFERFPTPWEGNGSWQASMYQYLKRLPTKNKTPNIYIINGTSRSGVAGDHRQMRYGLASALMGDGYFSFDNGNSTHGQLWWYDEYDVALGRAESSYYNLLNNNSDYVEPGLWRRDFENGVAIVNATGKDQLYIFPREQFEKIKGTQDRNFNDGSKVNYVRLSVNDGIIMRKIKQDIIASVFPNGNFVRVFNYSGAQQRNGFFAYRPDALPNALVLLEDLDNDGARDRITEQGGQIIVYRSGKSTVRISPYGANFKGKLSFAVYDFNKDGFKEIVVAPLSSGGPHVKIYSATGKMLNPGFFVFDKNFRGGVNLAIGDVNNDGKGEIIAAAGKGMPSTIKILSEQGRTLGSFSAYDKNFRGGVNVAVGDVDNDGKNELVTGAATGGPHVRIFDYAGRLRGQFMAYDPKTGTGISVMIADTDGDGKNEILAGTASF